MEILIADDSRMIRYMTIEALNALGYRQITEASNVSEARNLMLGKKKFDLIISDFHMPGETGLDFLRWVRATPEFAKMPFVLLTTDGEKKNIVAAVQAGVQAYLFKPVQKQALAQKLMDISKKFNFQSPNIAVAQAVSAVPSTEIYSAQSLGSYATALKPQKVGFSFEITNYGSRSIEIFLGKEMSEALPATVLEKYSGVRTVLLFDQQTQNTSKDLLEKWNQELSCFNITVPNAATDKNLKQSEIILDQLAHEGIDSSAVIIAVGDSNLLDLAGFVAAAYLGGITLLVVPQTLQAFLNSSVGTIRSVHGSQHTNIAAVPYDASMVWYDLAGLVGQADSAYVNECMEFLRYAFFGGAEILDAVNKSWDRVIKKDESAVMEFARLCLAARVSVRSLAISDSAKMSLLNFAQPIANALLQAPLKTPLHSGQALCKAILCMFDASNRSGAIMRANVPAIVELLKRMSLFKIAEPIDIDAVYQGSFQAEPLRKPPLRIPLIRDPGTLVLQENVPEVLLRESLTAVLNPPA